MRTRTALTSLAATLLLSGCGTLQASEVPAAPNSTTAINRTPASKGPGAAKAPRPRPSGTPVTGKTGAGTALAALAALPVKGRAAMTGYDRSRFGTEWSDAAGTFTYTRNGCDTRNDILARDLQRETVEANGCVVIDGVLAYEPYTGATNYYFNKPDGDYATDLDAEHVVALANAYVTGAQQWSEGKRAAFANDPDNLMMTDPSENRSKGDADFATWLPPNKAFRCSYAARQIRVKAKYGLWVTAPEKAAMERVLATCPDEPLDQPDPQEGYTAGKPDRKPAQADTPEPAPKSKSGSNGGSVYYENCTAAREAGAAPVRRGDPGYGSHLDRDGDGAACE